MPKTRSQLANEQKAEDEKRQQEQKTRDVLATIPAGDLWEAFIRKVSQHANTNIESEPIQYINELWHYDATTGSRDGWGTLMHWDKSYNTYADDDCIRIYRAEKYVIVRAQRSGNQLAQWHFCYVLEAEKEVTKEEADILDGL